MNPLCTFLEIVKVAAMKPKFRYFKEYKDLKAPPKQSGTSSYPKLVGYDNIPND